jgi:cytochrome c-type biogenesis protein CcmI
MNAVQWFLICAVLMCAAVVLVLAWSLRRASRAGLQLSEHENVLSQVAVYREHLAELQHELAQGTLDQAGFDTSHEELTQRLLEDTPPKTAAKPVDTPHWRGLVAGLALEIH